MQQIFNIMLIITTVVFFLQSAKDRNITSLVMISLSQTLILGVLKMDRGKTILILTMLLVSIYILFFGKRKIFISRKLMMAGIILGLFFIFYISSFLYSKAATSDYAKWKMGQVFLLIIFPALILFIDGDIDNVDALLWEKYVIITSLILSVNILFNMGANGFYNVLSSQWLDRQVIGNENPIWLGRYLGLALFFLFTNSQNLTNKSLIIFGFVLFISVFMTGSKSALFFTVALLLYYFFKKKRNVVKNRNIFFTVIILSVLGGLFVSKVNKDAIYNRFSLNSNTAQIRKTTFSKAYCNYRLGNTFNKVFGHGIGSSAGSLGLSYIRDYPHNILLELLYEVGLFGLMSFLIMILYGLSFLKNGRSNKYTYVFLLFFLFSLTSGDIPTNEHVFIYFIISMKF